MVGVLPGVSKQEVGGGENYDGRCQYGGQVNIVPGHGNDLEDASGIYLIFRITSW